MSNNRSKGKRYSKNAATYIPLLRPVTARNPARRPRPISGYSCVEGRSRRHRFYWHTRHKVNSRGLKRNILQADAR